MTQNQALEILKTGANVFLTGEPGSGKTYTINRYVEYLRSHRIEPAITASTGIAATHISGMTIHSWSGIGIKNRLNSSELAKIVANDYVDKRVSEAKVLIIDEISMLPPETLQSIELICRKIKKNQKPFGGIQVVLVGDFFQLPPVIKNQFNNNRYEEFFEENPARFAYDSPIWETAEFITCYINEQYRQDDTMLVSILSKIRSNTFDDISLSIISKRKIGLAKIPSDTPKLFSHNVDVDRENNRLLAKIPTCARVFQMESKGRAALVVAMKKGCLSPENLELKVGASVMFTKNNSKEGFVNGTLGVVDKFDNDSRQPIVKTLNGRKIKVSPMEWTVEENGRVKGLLRQIPLRLAWAITVHKSQGISLDAAIIDLSAVFEFGQGYVAISRVRRLSGIFLLGWNNMAFQVNPEVLKRDREFQQHSAETEKSFANFSAKKIEKMSEDFIISSGGRLKAFADFGRNKKPKVSTYDTTFNLWKEGKNIEQISKARNLADETILSHIETLVEQGQINQTELFRIIPANFVTDLEKIQQAFSDLKTDSLSSVFYHLNAKYSYSQIRIARMFRE
ncbi:MAG: helix-turn-helix domain-containing protein [Candidatus Berkelbacteria bacterium]|nr:helix-turn-helix domain-containing protein [Candidatus Berkelbacteria bacterium]